MYRILLLAALLTLMLTACGGTPEAPTSDSVSPTAESDTDESADAEPPAAEISSLDAGTFAASFSGKYSFTMSGPAVVTALPTGFNLSLAGASADGGDMPAGSTLVFLIPADIEPGTYPITLPFSEARTAGGLAANYTTLPPSSGAQSTPEAYGTVTAGRVTFDSVSPFSGTFEVDFEGGVAVRGAFNQAVLLSSGA